MDREAEYSKIDSVARELLRLCEDTHLVRGAGAGRLHTKLKRAVENLRKSDAERSLPEGEEARLTNCLLLAREDQEGPLFHVRGDAMYPNLDRYAIIPIEDYEKHVGKIKLPQPTSG